MNGKKIKFKLTRVITSIQKNVVFFSPVDHLCKREVDDLFIVGPQYAFLPFFFSISSFVGL